MVAKLSLESWTMLLLGLFYISSRCDARAVNISNTWTMPQEGINLFYRFFRDRISWFEADAVCQFHHANLVTVDNSFQFDATRDLLRELDVNDIVWIGLMRPQSSERFMWSNSRPLAAKTGYWAESLPLMDTPLCAVIDPIRDYRWHALRCGGPETASFLCEMSVPSWADACILKDIPSLTMQYMADTASIELIRNCGEGGLLRQTCKGKFDRERVINELICPKERMESQNLNDISNSHFKSLKIINSIATDNKENNDIEMGSMKTPSSLSISPSALASTDLTEQQAQTEKNTVQKLIEQFNVDELMQADEPARTMLIPGEIPKPVKKGGKKVITTFIKADKMHAAATARPKSFGKSTKEVIPLEDMMMGDQPAQYQHHYQQHHDMEMDLLDDDVSNEIVQPLPHIKKMYPYDLKTMSTITEKQHQQELKHQEQLFDEATTVRGESKIADVATSTVIMRATATSEGTPSVTSSMMSPSSLSPILAHEATIPTTTTEAPTATALPPTIGHRMHPQQQPSNVLTEEANHPHVKETNDNSHFIPPMLLVKSHYVPPGKMHEHEHIHEHDNEGNEHEHEHAHEHEHHDQGVQQHSSIGEIPSLVASTGDGAVEIPTEAIKLSHIAVASAGPSADTPLAALTSSTIAEEALQPLETVLHTSTHESTTRATIEMAIIHHKAAVIGFDGGPLGSKKVIESIAEKTTPHNRIPVTDGLSTTTASKEQHEQIQIPLELQIAKLIDASSATTINGDKTSPPVINATSVDVQMKATTTTKPTFAVLTTTAKSTDDVNQREITEIAVPSTATAEKESAHREEQEDDDESGRTESITIITSGLSTSNAQHLPAVEPFAAQLQQEVTSLATGAGPSSATTTISSTTRVEQEISTTTTTVAPTTTTTAQPPHPTRNFLKEETYAPYKPNRRRSLTKPESVSYLKKILG